MFFHAIFAPMNRQVIISLAFMGGFFLALQAAFNSQLSVLLKKPIFTATVSAFTSLLLCVLVVILQYYKEIPSKETLKQVPWYLWVAGGFFSVAGVVLYFFSIPKIGISKVIFWGLSGQIIFSVIAGHFSWFNLPPEPFTFKKIIGIIAMIVGIYFISSK